MAKRKGRPKTSERDDGTVKINRLLISRAKAIAGYKGVPAAQVLSEMLEGPLDKAYAEMLRDIDKKGGPD